MKLGKLNPDFKFPVDGSSKKKPSRLKPGNGHVRSKSASDVPIITVTGPESTQGGDSLTIQNKPQPEGKARRKSDVPAHARPNLSREGSDSRVASTQVALPAETSITSPRQTSLSAADSNNADLLDTSPLFRPGLGVKNVFSRRNSTSSEHSSDRDPFYYDRPKYAFLHRPPSPLTPGNLISNFMRPRTMSGTSSQSAVSSALYPAFSRSYSVPPSISQMVAEHAPSVFRRAHSRNSSGSSNPSSAGEEVPLGQALTSNENRLRPPSYRRGHVRNRSIIQSWLSEQSAAPSSPGHSRTSSTVSHSSSEMSGYSVADPALMNAFLHPSGTATILPSEPPTTLQAPSITVNQHTTAGGLSLFPTIRENPNAAAIRRELQESLAKKNEEQRKLLESSRSSIHSSPPGSVFDGNSDGASAITRRTRRTSTSSRGSMGSWSIYPSSVSSEASGSTRSNGSWDNWHFGNTGQGIFQTVMDNLANPLS